MNCPNSSSKISWLIIKKQNLQIKIIDKNKTQRTSSALRNDVDGKARKRENVPIHAIRKAIPNGKMKKNLFLSSIN